MDQVCSIYNEIIKASNKKIFLAPNIHFVRNRNGQKNSAFDF